MQDTIPYMYVINMTGTYQSRDIVSRGTINLGTSGPRTFVRGHIVSRYPVTPPLLLVPVQHCFLSSKYSLSAGGRWGEEHELEEYSSYDGWCVNANPLRNGLMILHESPYLLICTSHHQSLHTHTYICIVYIYTSLVSCVTLAFRYLKYTISEKLLSREFFFSTQIIDPNYEGNLKCLHLKDTNLYFSLLSMDNNGTGTVLNTIHIFPRSCIVFYSVKLCIGVYPWRVLYLNSSVDPDQNLSCWNWVRIIGSDPMPKGFEDRFNIVKLH